MKEAIESKDAQISSLRLQLREKQDELEQRTQRAAEVDSLLVDIEPRLQVCLHAKGGCRGS